MFLVAVAVPFTPVGATEPPRESFVVTLVPTTAQVEPLANGILSTTGATVTAVYERGFDGFATDLTASEVTILEHDPRVANVEPDIEFRVEAQTVSTGVARVGATANPSLRIDGVDSNRVDADVAVLDSGIDLQHPDLNIAGGVDCVAGPTCVAGGDDTFGHGTHVAGIIGALDNGTGVVGVAPGVRLWAVKVLDASGAGTLSSVLRGLDWVAAHSGVIDVVNMSFGAAGTSQAMHDAIQAAVNSGVMFAVAAGNQSIDASGIVPASFDNVLAVSALVDFDGLPGSLGAPTCGADVDDTLASFSNRGSVVDITAPGMCIESTLPIESGSYGVLSGTSMASPHVAAALALLVGHQRPISAAQVAQVSAQLLAAGKQDWVDDSGDGVQEPRLDVSAPALFTAGPAPACATSSATGLTAWWRGEGGSTAAVGQALSGTPGFTTGVSGNAFSLSGASNLRATVPAAADGLTVAFWARPASGTGHVQTLVGRWDFPTTDDTSRAFTLQLSPDGTLVFATDETSSRRPLELRVPASPLLDGSFHHVAATWSTTTASVYLDGSLIATVASQGGTLNPTASTPLRIGAEGGAGGASFPMSGAIDEVALWSRALSASEIRDIVVAGSTGLCPVP